MSDFRMRDLLLVPFVFGVAMFFSAMFSRNESVDPSAFWILVALLLAYPHFGKGRKRWVFGGEVTFAKWLAYVAVAGLLLWIVGLW